MTTSWSSIQPCFITSSFFVIGLDLDQNDFTDFSEVIQPHKEAWTGLQQQALDRAVEIAVAHAPVVIGQMYASAAFVGFATRYVNVGVVHLCVV